MNSIQVLILYITRVLLGSIITLIVKLQKKTIIDNYSFNHPTIHSLIISIGTIAASLILILYAKSQQQQHSIARTHWTSIISGIIGALENPLSSLALYYSPASVFQMIKSMLFIYVMVFSVIFLKENFQRIQMLGITIIIAGIVLIAITEFGKIGTSDASIGTRQLGMILCLVAQLLHAVIIVIQDYAMKPSQIQYTYVALYSNIYAFIGTLVFVLPFLSYYKCSNRALCEWDEIENISIGLHQMEVYKPIIAQLILLAAGYGVCSVMSLLISKVLSAMARSSVENVKTAVIWIVCIFLRWEKLILIELIGFMLICIGTLLYSKEKINTKKTKIKVLYH